MVSVETKQTTTTTTTKMYWKKERQRSISIGLVITEPKELDGD
jgi:hypothetical protein